jgi:flagellar secretion chaperone FliS
LDASGHATRVNTTIRIHADASTLGSWRSRVRWAAPDARRGACQRHGTVRNRTAAEMDRLRRECRDIAPSGGTGTRAEPRHRRLIHPQALTVRGRHFHAAPGIEDALIDGYFTRIARPPIPASMSYAARTISYLEADAVSRSREWLFPLLHQHLVSTLRRAQAQMEVGNMEGTSESVDRASAIVMELLRSLDQERGAEVAEGLAALYGYLAGEILAAGRALDAVRLDRVVIIVVELHASWGGAAELVVDRTGPGGSRPGGRLA